MASGNAQFILPICSWSGRGGLQFALVFNSQSARTGTLGPKWTHSYRTQIVAGTNQATVIEDDGTETIHEFSSAAQTYIPPLGVYDALATVSGGGWLLTRKNGTQYAFNASGSLTSMTDLNGNQISLTYNANAVVITDASGRTLTLGYSGGLLRTITQFSVGYVPVRVWTLGYDTSGRLKSVSDPLLAGQTTPYTRQIGYDSNNNVNSLTNRLNKTWQFSYSGMVFSSQTDPDNSACVWTLAYATQNVAATPTLATWTNALGNRSHYSLDSAGRTLSYADFVGDATSSVYDSANNLTQRQTADGAQWNYLLDSSGNTTRITDPFGKITTQNFDAYGRLIYSKDPINRETRYNYDANNPGLLDSIQDANGNFTYCTYYANSGGLLQQITDQEDRVTQFGYDAYGHQTSVTVYPTATTPKTTQYAYYADSRVQQRTDARNRVTNYTYDNWGRLIQTAYPTSGRASVVLTLDAESRITQAVDGTGTRTFQYDAWGRKTQATDPMAAAPMTAHYDSEGRLLNQQDVTGRVHAYTYDMNGRMLTVSAPSGYQANGQPLAVGASYQYNQGLFVNQANINGTGVDYSYDRGRLIDRWVYGVSGNTQPTIDDESPDTGAQYDAAGRIIQLIEYQSDADAGATTTLAYDVFDNVTSEIRQADADPNLSVPYSGAYSYDKTGLRKTATRINRNYNSSGHDYTLHNGTYVYDRAGRLSTVTETAPDFAGTENYAWYDDGTLASYPYNGVTAIPDYDEEGRMILLSYDSGNGGGPHIATAYGYGYDGARRWKKDYRAGTATWYPCGVACDAGELVELSSTLNASGNFAGTWQTNALYIKGLQVVCRVNSGSTGGGSGGSPIPSGASAANFEFHHYDFFNNVSILTDLDSSVLERSVYDSFGVLRAREDNLGNYYSEPGLFPPDDPYELIPQSPYGYGKADDGGLLQDAGCDGESLPSRDLCGWKPPTKKPGKRPKTCEDIGGKPTKRRGDVAKCKQKCKDNKSYGGTPKGKQTCCLLSDGSIYTICGDGKWHGYDTTD